MTCDYCVHARLARTQVAALARAVVGVIAPARVARALAVMQHGVCCGTNIAGVRGAGRGSRGAHELGRAVKCS